ncbi:class I SAM-dependent methyltransferase [Roseibium sp. MMSF_3412]|uniref:class I SAM-dependent methyltransferase n=1 Tax=Roseibium sp. MMSF_3412 TaxID=3046712 RepID=UPI00273DC3A7|nr:class I SAM-dependent methyltransferase [Roseibium sp. MMSF_3412]
MSGFSSDWLALREPLDLAARDQAVEAAFMERVPSAAPRMLDLASGAGSTVAALKHHLPEDASWLLTDYDHGLLEVATSRWSTSGSGDLATLGIDLASDVEALPFSEVDAISTSAFLDLVSEPFLQRLVNCVVEAGKPFLASLSYDGRIGFEPASALDDTMRDALNHDQLSDKGFGKALGPGAAARAIDLFRSAGYQVVQGPSDWEIGPSDTGFLAEFLSGWSSVGVKYGASGEQVEAWRSGHLDQAGAGRFRCTVGHIDFAAFPGQGS